MLIDCNNFAIVQLIKVGLSFGSSHKLHDTISVPQKCNPSEPLGKQAELKYFRRQEKNVKSQCLVNISPKIHILKGYFRTSSVFGYTSLFSLENTDYFSILACGTVIK